MNLSCFDICHSCRIQKLRERYKNENEQIPDRYMDVFDAFSVRVRCAKKTVHPIGSVPFNNLYLPSLVPTSCFDQDLMLSTGAWLEGNIQLHLLLLLLMVVKKSFQTML